MHQSLESVEKHSWDGLAHGQSPFLRYGFLRAAEVTGSTGPGSGWQPLYVTIEQDGKLAAAAPFFIKGHSYGEYIFDWQWAHLAERMGIDYYPKIVCAAPMTPASGRRVLVSKDANQDDMIRVLAKVAMSLAEDIGASSIHWLFETKQESEVLAECGFSPRASFQFHWHNQEYSSFDDFLGRLASRKRKQFRKERRVAQQAVDKIDVVLGDDICTETLDAMDDFYRKTVMEHGGYDYLRPGFFQAAHELMAEDMLVIRAWLDDEIIGGALFFIGDNALYGRYWGCSTEIPMLHFELAYYQAIEYCIATGIGVFEAGAQGGHKLLRGFSPTRTYSSHWIADERLRVAIEQFLPLEASEVKARMSELAERGPYKQDC